MNNAHLSDDTISKLALIVTQKVDVNSDLNQLAQEVFDTYNKSYEYLKSINPKKENKKASSKPSGW